mmetsp:Transcript_13280/g.16690  ORF Transcript_13280/g.16690 Transcript_13280/m.16690 type:complete len:208 (-) Transcript_13280:14-637(-)
MLSFFGKAKKAKKLAQAGCLIKKSSTYRALRDIEVIVCDMDDVFWKPQQNPENTFGYLYSRDSLHDGVKEAIISLQQRGIRVILCSKHPESEANHLAEQLDLPTTLVVSGESVQSYESIVKDESLFAVMNMTTLEQKTTFYQSLSIYQVLMVAQLSEEKPLAELCSLMFAVDSASDYMKELSDGILLSSNGSALSELYSAITICSKN